MNKDALSSILTKVLGQGHLTLHLQMHFYIRNADEDVGKPPIHLRVIPSRMNNDAGSLELPVYVRDI